MACCKAEKFDGWCKRLPSPYVDSDGKEYCLFHAPKEHKGVTLDKFNKKIDGIVKAATTKKKGCNLSGTIFLDDIGHILRKYSLFQPINLRQATFNGDANFSGITFNDEIDFSSATFNEGSTKADFSGAIFSGKTGFSGAIFNGKTDFSHTIFTNDVNFSSATFTKETNFSSATFTGEGTKADFSRTIFSSKADFSNTIFSGWHCTSYPSYPAVSGWRYMCDHSNTDIRHATDFSGTYYIEDDLSNNTFSGWCYTVDFSCANFGGETNFSKSTFHNTANFSNTTFIGETDFSSATFFGETDFSFATFNSKTLFDQTIFDADENAKFCRTIYKKACFRRVKAEESGIYFKKVDFSVMPVSFLDTDLTNFRFEHCVWPSPSITHDFYNLFDFLLNSDNSDVFYDEIKAEHDFSTSSLRDKFSYDMSHHYGMVEDLYRQMKHYAKETHNEIDASKWHYREKEMFRKKKILRRYLLSITNLYRISSGYGERPIRAGVMLGVSLCAVIIVTMRWFELNTHQAIQATIEHALFVKAPAFTPAPGWGAIIFTLWTKLIIPINAALFVFALRNKFRR